VLLFPVLVVLALAAWQLPRAGYSTDEEFTLFAVRGIESSGLPLLPSGLLYDRGIAYSYAAWLGGVIATPSLPTYRAVGYAAAVAALVALFALVRTAATSSAAWLAVALTAVTLPFVAVATTARFYAPFLLLYLLALRALAAHGGGRGPAADRRSEAAVGASGVQPSRGSAWPLAGLAVLSFLARGTHELAFTLAAVPIAALLAGPRSQRRAWAASSVAVIAGLVAAQLALVALHQMPPVVAPAALPSPAAASSDPPSMLTRFFVWQVVNLIEWPLDPLDFFAHIARTMPGLTVGVLALFVMRLLGRGAPWTGPQRFAHVLWAGWTLFFGVIDSGITINYQLVPVTLMTIALAVDLAALVPPRQFAPIAALLVATVAAEQWGGPGQAAIRLDAARPAIATPEGIALGELAARAQRVACTDELACLLLAGRVDRWLALDDFVRTRFIVSRNGRDEGVYAGRPVARTLPELFAPADGEPAPSTVLVIDVFKELPVGPSSRFLERALIETPCATRVIAEDARMRVLEIRPLPPSPAASR
jgi:hypothetical protein